MKNRIAFWMMLLLIMSSSCKKTENCLVSELDSFTKELKDNSESFSQTNWDEAQVLYDAFKIRIRQTKLNLDEQRKVDDMLKLCNIQFSKRWVAALEQLKQKLDDCSNFSEKEWTAASEEYQNILQHMSQYDYEEGMNNEIKGLCQQCRFSFSKKPVYELQSLLYDIDVYQENLTFSQRKRIRERFDTIQNKLKEYEYNENQQKLISVLNDTILKRLDETRWTSLKQSVVEEGKDLKKRVLDLLNNW